MGMPQFPFERSSSGKCIGAMASARINFETAEDWLAR